MRIIFLFLFFIGTLGCSFALTSFPLTFKTYFQDNPADSLAFRTGLSYGRSLKQNENWQWLGRVGQHFSIVEINKNNKTFLGGVRFDLATTMDNSAYRFSHFQIFTLDGRFGLFLDFKKDSLITQIALDHWSAHYVDGSSISLISNRSTYSFEDAKFSLNYNLSEHLKLFGQLTAIFSGQKKFIGKLTSNLGALYLFTFSKKINPLASINFYMDGKNQYGVEKSVLLGVGLGKQTDHFIIGMQYIDGFKKQGMNYNRKMEYIGASIILPFF